MAVNSGALTIASGVVDVLGLMLTLFRLSFRIRIRRFWWEDAWACAVFVCGTTVIVTQIICAENVNYATTRLANWLLTYFFTCTIWAVRMSLLCSITRITSSSSTLRKITNAIAVLFFLCWAGVFTLKIWWCTNNTKPLVFFGSIHPSFRFPEPVIFFVLISDCISDAILVCLSVKLCWGIKLPRRQRRMILSTLLSTVVMSMCSVFHTICQLVAEHTIQYVASDLELSLALIVCNLLVAVTYVYRMILRSPNGSLPSESESTSEDDDFTTPVPGNRTTQYLTTVDLDLPGSPDATAGRGSPNGAISSLIHCPSVD